MKRCNICGHTSGRLRPAKNYYSGRPIPGQFVCVSLAACIRRMELAGQWVGKRVLRRIDRDGTEWTIRRGVGAPPRPDVVGRDFVLTLTYRENRLTSWHTSIDAAKAHADEMLASLIKPKAEDYRVPEESADQMELL